MSLITRQKFIFFLARYGAFSIGIIYAMIGTIAMLSLLKLKKGGADEDSILDLLGTFGAGKIFIVLLLTGLLSYILWRIYEAIQDPYDFGNDIKALAKRAGIGMGALAYAIIGYSAIEALLGIDPDLQGKPEEQQLLVSRIFQWVAGEWIIAFAGIIVAIAGIVEFKYMASKEYKVRLKVETLSEKQRKFIRVLAWAGHLARAVILCIIAYSLLSSAFTSNPGNVLNTDKAFNFLGESILGHPAFVVVALGTICYGLYMFMLAWYYDFDATGA
jgi:hypothetical protein